MKSLKQHYFHIINNRQKNGTTKRARRGGALSMKKLKIKKKLKIIEDEPITINLVPTPTMIDKLPKIYNTDFIAILGELKDILKKQGEPFKSRAYEKAQDAIIHYSDDITDLDQIKGLPGIGTTVLAKLDEYIKTGTLAILERERANPINLFTDIYGVGPKKADELVKLGITTIAQLKENVDKLNDLQKVGLKYYDDILRRIPRAEIVQFHAEFETFFNKYAPPGSSFEIVGSYRRNKPESGDIDIIITNKDNNSAVFGLVLDQLIKDGIIIEVLSKGKVKSLTIVKILPDAPARRVDFLYAPPNEHAFAILYFTGSKEFNTVMRQRALTLGYTLNEHGLSEMVGKTKGAPIDVYFPDERAIFDFLGMVYKNPAERINGRSVELKKTPEPEPDPEPDPEPEKKKAKSTHRKTLKKLKIIEPDLLNTFKTEGINGLKAMTEAELSRLLHQANHKYYCDGDGQPIMTDNQYDILREYTLEKYPSNETAKAGHTQCLLEVEKNKVPLPYEMWSMDKIKPETDALIKWRHKYTGPYVVSCKLDGVSGLYSTEGPSPKLYTRGNGQIGQDISHLIPYLKLPKTTGLALRGEFVIKKSVFKTDYADKFANARNLVAGIINQKTITPEKYKAIDFVAYEVIMPELKPSDQMKFLAAEAVECVQNVVVTTLSNEYLSETLLAWRESYIYEIDGIIVIEDKIYPRPTGNPPYAFAFKMILADQVAEAKVVNVLWTPSQDGYLKPRVQIVPTVLDGVTIEYITGNNAKYIIDNQIGLGALITIVRSGGVIPKIISVVEPAEPMLPLIEYEWNDSHVDFIVKDKLQDKTVIAKNIAGFFTTLGVDGLGPGNINRIIDAGYNTVPKIIAMSKDDFLKVDGFKDKLASKIHANIEATVASATLPELMAASNVFGRGFALKKFQLILKAAPTVLVSSESDGEKINRLKQIDGMAQKTSEKFVEKIADFIEFMTVAKLMGTLASASASASAASASASASAASASASASASAYHLLYEQKIVFTGSKDKILMDKIRTVGGDLSSSVSKNTFAVIVKDKTDETGKLAQARKLNIPIMTPEEFTAKYFS